MPGTDGRPRPALVSGNAADLKTLESPLVIYDLLACFGSNARRGIGRYVEELARALYAAGAPVAFVAPPDALDPERFGFPVQPSTNRSIRALVQRGARVFHSASLFEFPTSSPVIPQLVTELGLIVSATLFDVIPYEEPNAYQASHVLRNFYAQRAVLLRSCNVLLACSNHSIDTAIALTHVRRAVCTMVGAGVADRFHPAAARPQTDSDTDTELTSSQGPYVLCVGGNDPRKNAKGLIEGFALLPRYLRESRELVLAGWVSNEYRSALTAHAERFGCSEQIRFAGEVDDDALVALYQGAELTVFPSLNEGFGLPVAEAAACGRPTVTSNTASLPEILESPESTFDPRDPADIARLIRRGLVDEAFRARLQESGRRAAQRWKWPAVATAAMDAWMKSVANPLRQGAVRSSAVSIDDSAEILKDQALERNTAIRARSGPASKLAFVGPFGGSPSGIGSYNERLVPDLASRFDLTCFVEKFWGEAPLGIDGQRFPAEALDRHFPRRSFDHVVVSLGNSPFHISTLVSRRTVGSHVWFHEAQLAEAHIGTANLMRCYPWAQNHLRTLLERDGHRGDIARLEAGRGPDGLLDVYQYQQIKIRLVRPALDGVRSVIVSSDVAARLFRSPEIGYDGPLLVLPLAFPSGVASAPTTAPAGGDIAILGWMSERKGLAQAMVVLRRLRLTEPRARMVFIGRENDGATEALQTAADAAGVADAVEVLGFLSDPDLRRRLTGVRAGLRLGGGDDGQMSAAVLEIAAHGVPVVTDVETTGFSSLGVNVSPGASTDQIAASLLELLNSDATFLRASADAVVRAKSWTFSDVAYRLSEWIDRF